MGLKTIKMEWDLCSSPPWIQFYPYTMFQNPMPKPSCQKFRKTLIIQKVHVTQSSIIMHCDWHTQKTYMCRFSSLSNTFSLYKLTFFHFLSGGAQQTVLTVEMWNCHSWPLDACGGRGRSASWSASMSSNSRNVKLPFLTTRCLYQGSGGRSFRWSTSRSSNSTDLKFLSTWAVRISMWIFQYESQIAILRGVDLQVQFWMICRCHLICQYEL